MSSFISQKYYKRDIERLNRNKNVVGEILRDIYDILKIIKKFESTEINIKCSEYLYKNRKSLTNEQLFNTIRYAIAGMKIGPELGCILGIIGKNSALERIKWCLDFHGLELNNK